MLINVAAGRDPMSHEAQTGVLEEAGGRREEHAPGTHRLYNK